MHKWLIRRLPTPASRIEFITLNTQNTPNILANIDRELAAARVPFTCAARDTFPDHSARVFLVFIGTIAPVLPLSYARFPRRTALRTFLTTFLKTFLANFFSATTERVPFLRTSLLSLIKSLWEASVSEGYRLSRAEPFPRRTFLFFLTSVSNWQLLIHRLQETANLQNAPR